MSHDLVRYARLWRACRYFNFAPGSTPEACLSLLTSPQEGRLWRACRYFNFAPGSTPEACLSLLTSPQEGRLWRACRYINFAPGSTPEACLSLLTSPQEGRLWRACRYFNFAPGSTPEACVPIRLLPDAFNQAAIDAQYTASDVTGRRARQECDDARELVRPPIAPSWNCRYRRAHNFIDRFSLTLSSLRVQLVDTLSLDPSRHQHVDRDAVGSDLGSNRLGPAYE